MLLAIAAVIGGLILLVWSADKFVKVPRERRPMRVCRRC